MQQQQQQQRSEFQDRMERLAEENRQMQEDLQAQRVQNDAKQEAASKRMADLEGLIMKIAEQGKNNTTELVNMSEQITAVFTQLNNLQGMLSAALQQRQTLQPAVYAEGPTNGEDGMDHNFYGKGDGKNALIAAAGSVNHNLY